MKAIIKVANTAANPNQELFIERIYFSFVNYQIMFETTPHQTLAMVFDTIENAAALTEYFRSTGSGLYEIKDIIVIPTPEEKDIEKRASARYPYADDIDADPNSWAAKKACIEMAKEQQEIDIQRAVDAHCKLCRYFNGIGNVCTSFYECDERDMIRKAMKGE